MVIGLGIRLVIGLGEKGVPYPRCHAVREGQGTNTIYRSHDFYFIIIMTFLFLFTLMTYFFSFYSHDLFFSFYFHDLFLTFYSHDLFFLFTLMTFFSFYSHDLFLSFYFHDLLLLSFLLSRPISSPLPWRARGGSAYQLEVPYLSLRGQGREARLRGEREQALVGGQGGGAVLQEGRRRQERGPGERRPPHQVGLQLLEVRRRAHGGVDAQRGGDSS